MTEWKQNIVAVLTLVVAVFGLIYSMIQPLNQIQFLMFIIISFITISMVSFAIWYYRVPKINLEKAEQIALEYLKKEKGFQNIKIDKTKQNYLVGRTWRIFVKRESSQGYACQLV